MAKVKTSSVRTFQVKPKRKRPGIVSKKKSSKSKSSKRKSRSREQATKFSFSLGVSELNVSGSLDNNFPSQKSNPLWAYLGTPISRNLGGT